MRDVRFGSTRRQKSGLILTKDKADQGFDRLECADSAWLGCMGEGDVDADKVDNTFMATLLSGADQHVARIASLTVAACFYRTMGANQAY